MPWSLAIFNPNATVPYVVLRKSALLVYSRSKSVVSLGLAFSLNTQVWYVSCITVGVRAWLLLRREETLSWSGCASTRYATRIFESIPRCSLSLLGLAIF